MALTDDAQPTILNAHLSSLMPGLSAKVFRTYNASETLQNELPSPEDLEGMSVPDKVGGRTAASQSGPGFCHATVVVGAEAAVAGGGWWSWRVCVQVLAYNEANRKVAILCNHQRTVTKAMENTLENLAERVSKQASSQSTGRAAGEEDEMGEEARAPSPPMLPFLTVCAVCVCLRAWRP